MVAASLGAQVTIIERAGMGGSAVLTDVVPSKTLIATADLMTRVGEAGELGVKFDVDGGDFVPAMRADLKHINDRLLGLARQQSTDISSGLEHQNVRILLGSGKLLDNHTIEVLTARGTEIVEADTILLAVGAHPRELLVQVRGGKLVELGQPCAADGLPRRGPGHIDAAMQPPLNTLPQFHIRDVTCPENLLQGFRWFPLSQAGVQAQFLKQ